MKIFKYISLIFVFNNNIVLAQEEMSPKLKELCNEAINLQIPKEDLPTAEEKNKLVNCQSKNYYYGINSSVNYELARKCAYIELEMQRKNLSEHRYFSGADILSQIYANGFEVKQNKLMAIKFACDQSNFFIESEKIDYIESLNLFINSNEKNKKIEFCDFQSSGITGASCYDIQNQKEIANIKNNLAEFKKSLNSNELMVYESLEISFNKFNDLSAQSDISRHYSSHYEDILKLENNNQYSFYKLVMALKNADGKLFKKYNLLEEDKKLNAEYKKVMNAKFIQSVTIKKENIVLSQRAWIVYRDNFEKFLQIKAPKLSSESLKAYLSYLRKEQLKELKLKFMK